MVGPILIGEVTLNSILLILSWKSQSAAWDLEAVEVRRLGLDGKMTAYGRQVMKVRRGDKAAGSYA
jgi:hypothetical protein